MPKISFFDDKLIKINFNYFLSYLSLFIIFVLSIILSINIFDEKCCNGSRNIIIFLFIFSVNFISLIFSRLICLKSDKIDEKLLDNDDIIYYN